MSDLIERLRRPQGFTGQIPHHQFIRLEAADEIERLTAALKWEQHRAERQGTHGEGCANWGPAHYECLLRERDELRRQLAEANRRFDWLAERLEDVQIDNADPNDNYLDDEEDVPYTVLWRRAIDAAMAAPKSDERREG